MNLYDLPLGTICTSLNSPCHIVIWMMPMRDDPPYSLRARPAIGVP